MKNLDLISSIQQESQTTPEPKVNSYFKFNIFIFIERKGRMALVRL